MAHVYTISVHGAFGNVDESWASRSMKDHTYSGLRALKPYLLCTQMPRVMELL